jgi:hypothetical protein
MERKIGRAIYRGKDLRKTRKEDVYFHWRQLESIRETQLFLELPSLVEDLSNIGLTYTLEEYYLKRMSCRAIIAFVQNELLSHPSLLDTHFPHLAISFTDFGSTHS